MNITKGKWERHNAPNGEHLWAGDKHIADFDGPDANANAKLCVAAPDMLEALKLLQAALTEYRLRDAKKRYSLCVADAAASNAIAKAEGGE